jgi:DNA-directed RNA polymerase subunit L/DNA-directed RNA polymerase alpha subunit
MFQNLKRVDSRTLSFTLSPTRVTYANTLRRAIQTEVSTLGFRSDITENGSTSDVKVLKNTTPISNEMFADRIGLLPLWHDWVDSVSNWDKEKVLFKLHVKNESDQVRVVTAADFECLERTDEGEPRRIPNTVFFHPDPVTGDTPILIVLKPQIEGQEPEEVHVEAYASFGIGREHTRFNPASQCAYRYSLDSSEERINARWVEWLESQKKVKRADLEKQPERKAALEREFRSLEVYRCYKQDADGEPMSYDFTVETVGPLQVQGMIYDALLAVSALGDSYAVDLPNNVDIRPADWASPVGFDFWFANEDHTLGNLLQTWIAEEYPDVFVGYKVPHPLRPEMVLRIGVKEEVEARRLISEASAGIADMFRGWAQQWIGLVVDEKISSPKTPEFAGEALPPWQAHEQAKERKSKV